MAAVPAHHIAVMLAHARSSSSIHHMHCAQATKQQRMFWHLQRSLTINPTLPIAIIIVSPSIIHSTSSSHSIIQRALIKP
jgi:hypothetical protein